VGENTMRVTLWTFEVEHVKFTTWLEDALDRPQRPVLFVGRQVVEHKRREHPVEARRRVWKVISKSLIELDGNRRLRCFAPGAGKSLGVRVDSNHLDVRMKTLDQCRQCACTTTNIENAIPWPKGRMIK
jgi:hypothetical protein